jgi:hypothetical protein
MRFRIGTFMVAVAVVAVLLVGLRFGQALIALFLGGCILTSHGLWLAARRYKRLPAAAFTVAGLLLNLFCLAVSMTGSYTLVVVLGVLPCLIGTAVAFSFGAAWCAASAPGVTISGHSRALRWTVVAIISIAPLTMILTRWPFRLAFLVSRPALERLADQVVSGVPVTSPRRAGAFVIVGSAVDPTTGNVGLITGPRSSGRSGFERYGARGSRGAAGAFYNFWSETELDANWRFAEED